ncbi:MAG: hypothetical protein RL154_476 [Pseudomonadota bacterium]|jgi:two-component system chemotaxis response regulator CheY
MSDSTLKALIVDDSATIRKIIKANLSKFNITLCDDANDGKAAWQLLLNKEYNFLFVDYNMPEMNGLELVKKISCNTERFAGLKIIAISSAFSKELIEQYKEFGVKIFIVKPFSLDMFKEAFEPLLSNDALAENKEVSLDDISKLFEICLPQTSFNGTVFVLDFGGQKLTIDASAIGQYMSILKSA